MTGKSCASAVAMRNINFTTFVLFWMARMGTGQKSPEDFRVHGLADIEPAFASVDGNMFSGLISARENSDAELFFWLITNDSSDSLVIWFNGGPGCSSIDAGFFFEMGPVTTPLHPAGYDNLDRGNEAPLKFNKYTWANVSNIMYIEQPVGVGYTHGSPKPQDEDEVAADFYRFLQNFFDIFPKMRKQRLFLVGESYAGMYVPSMAHYIHEKATSDDPKINLKGIALGNGWVDAVKQGPLVIDYAWWHGMIDTVYRDALWSAWADCINGSISSPFHKFTVPDECGIMGAVLEAAGAKDGQSPNTYDVTTWDTYPVLTSDTGYVFLWNECARLQRLLTHTVFLDHRTFAKFLNRPEVKDALNVGHVKKEWMGCIPGAGRRKLSLLDNDRPLSMARYMADLLDKTDIDVLVYNGDDDMSTCSQGSELFLNDMEWSGQSDWLDPSTYSRGLWKVNGKVAGHAKSVRNLHFLVVYNRYE